MKYRITGRRFVREYTAAALTPVYASRADAAIAAEGIAACLWRGVDAAAARLAHHSNEFIGGKAALDLNVEERAELDAALFCAEHAHGLHRAYANAACYVFELPDMSSYPEIVAVCADVTSDPYNAGGVRLAVHLADTPDIPRDWDLSRAGIAHAAGVAPRGEYVGSDKRTYWSATSARAELAVNAPGKKYLMLVVALEDYNQARGDWLEGSAYISPEIEIETTGAIDGWSESGVNAAVGDYWYLVTEEGGGFALTESIATIGDAVNGEAVIAAVTGDWTVGVLLEKDGVFSEIGELSDANLQELWNGGANNAAWSRPDRLTAIAKMYGDFYAGKMRRHITTAPRGKEITAGGIGAAWSVDIGATSFLCRKKLLIPFLAPAGARFGRCRLSWSESDATANVTGTPIKRNVWIARGVIDDYGDAVLQRPQLYTAAVGKVGAFKLAASLDCAVGDTNPGIDIAAEIAGGEVYTILLTCYIEPGAVGAAGDDIFLGTGGETWYADGIITGGWAPRIELLK